MTRGRVRLTPGAACLVLAGMAALAGGCGKKGAPLPPLVRVPAPPADFAAERRGADVKVQFTVPAANADGSKPANIERIDVYRFTGPIAATDAQLLKLGTRVASLPVKTPRNPDVATEADEPEEEPDLKDEGLDQGSVTQFEDELDGEAFSPIDLPSDKRKTRARAAAADADRPGPLVGPPDTVPSTIYAAVGVNPGGRRGPWTRRILIPLVPPPMPPSSPTIEYEETTVHVTWARSASPGGEPQAGAGDLLPSRVFGLPATILSYHVYDVSPAATATAPNAAPPLDVGHLRLTPAPLSETKFDDARITWGTTRCYTVRTVETVGGLTLESDAPPPTCATLTDRFPPAAPRDLKAVATERAVTLIWEPNNEKDLGGYLVLRGVWGAETLERLTPDPIQQSSYDDKAQPGTHYVYAVQAIDKAGNVSPMSNRADDTAR